MVETYSVLLKLRGAEFHYRASYIVTSVSLVVALYLC